MYLGRCSQWKERTPERLAVGRLETGDAQAEVGRHPAILELLFGHLVHGDCGRRCIRLPVILRGSLGDALRIRDDEASADVWRRWRMCRCWVSKKIQTGSSVGSSSSRILRWAA